jgi:16S rRNA (cytosine967-C5)-methyltransferase
MPGARDAALAILTRVESDQAFAAAVLESELGRVSDPRDRALTTELVLGCLRRRSWLDHLLESAATRGLAGIDPSIRQILRIAAYQLAFLERVPARAAVSAAVDQARSSRAGGLAGLVNGLLRNLAGRDRSSLRPPDGDDAAIEELACWLGQPAWLLARLVGDLGLERATAICNAYNRQSRRTLRINTARVSREAALEGLGGAGRLGELSPWSLHVEQRDAARRLVDDGLASFQDEGAQLVALAVSPQPGQRILDACAGRGGKTGALANATAGDAELVAVDRQPSKLERLEFELARQELTATTIAADLTADSTNLGQPFDRVLLDAPCSGSGTLGRRPEIRWRLSADDVASLARVQQQLLEAAAAVVAPGGRLVLAVCSIVAEECDAHLAAFLEHHPDFALVPDPPARWPDKVPWNGGLIFVDPSETQTDGYRMAVLNRQ